MPTAAATGDPAPDRRSGVGGQAVRHRITLRVIYDGAGPVHWTSDEFGVQDKAGKLHAGDRADGMMTFDLPVEVGGDRALPNFLGPWTHGPASGRFLYLGWRNRNGALAQRLKLPLTTIGWDDVRLAHDTGQPLVAVVVDHHPRATTTGANIGGTRPVAWHVGRPLR